MMSTKQWTLSTRERLENQRWNAADEARSMVLPGSDVLHRVANSIDHTVDLAVRSADDNLFAQPMSFYAQLHSQRVDAARLRILADQLAARVGTQNQASKAKPTATPIGTTAPGMSPAAEINLLIGDLRDTDDVLFNELTILPDRAQRIADALLLEGSETAERLTQAGLTAAEALREVEALRQYNRALIRTVAALAADVEALSAGEGHPITITFQIAEADSSAAGIDPELASDLALLLTDTESHGA